MKLPYDHTSPQSILRYAQTLLGKNLKQLHSDAVAVGGGRGKMGQTVEKYHFMYAPNSTAAPDFPEAGVELKCTPLKELSDHSLVAKERLVLNIINYLEEADKTFETSSFWHKNKLILLMYYLHEQGVDIVKLFFKIVRLWEFPEVDLKIIRDDWEKIHWKIANGHAHEISEGDTLYLAACCKGSRAGADMRPQVGSTKLAQQRAYSLKPMYMNTIILESMLHPEMSDNLYISEAQRIRIQDNVRRTTSVVKSVSEYREHETFEQLIERKFKPYYGKTILELEKQFDVVFSNSPKAISNDVIHTILNARGSKIREFEKANIQQKSIRLEYNGKLRESMVFDQIKYMDIIHEDLWEDSVWYNILTQRFLFIVFRKNEDSKAHKKSVLEKVFFWTMPPSDLAVARNFWEDTKNKIAKGIYNNFWKLGDDRICHVRPKAKDKSDTMEGPSREPGKTTMITKKGYWLNAKYILNVVNQNMQEQSKQTIKVKPSFISDYEYMSLEDKYGFIPLYSVSGACGYFGGDQLVEKEGWIDARDVIKFPDSKRHFVVHASGDSMIPQIKDGDLVIFEWCGNRDLKEINRKIVLSEYGGYDSSYHGSYTIKQLIHPYSTAGIHRDLFENQIFLKPLNEDYQEIEVNLSMDSDFKIVGLFVGVL